MMLSPAVPKATSVPRVIVIPLPMYSPVCTPAMCPKPEIRLVTPPYVAYWKPQRAIR